MSNVHKSNLVLAALNASLAVFLQGPARRQTSVILRTAGGRIIKLPLVWPSYDSFRDLLLVESPFVLGGQAGPADVFRVLWRHHAFHIRPDGVLTNQDFRAASVIGKLRARIARAWIRHLVGRLAWPVAALYVDAWLVSYASGSLGGDTAQMKTGVGAHHAVLPT